MADGKWIAGLTPETPVVDAARRVLGARLEVVRHYLPLAASVPEEDIEYVHQLRVATRRTASALRIFENCLPKKRAKEANRRLRRVRRAAGSARDWDVFQETLAGWASKRPADEQPALDFLRGYAFLQRVNAQPGLIEAANEGIDFTTTLAAIGEPADFDAPRRLEELAPDVVNTMLKQLDAELAAESDDYEQLHRVRIVGKRLRYAMEVFADCFAPTFRHELYPAVEEMQEILGQANDSHVATQRLSELRHQLKVARPADWLRYRAGLEKLIQHHRRRLPDCRKRFGVWRQHWHALRTAVPRWAAFTPVAPTPAEPELA